MTRFSIFLIALCGLALPAKAQDGSATVFAAASLRGVLEDLAEVAPMPLTLAFGGSGTMARQVATGAPADVVILASADWMLWLVGQGTPMADAPRDVARNRLVVIAADGSAPLKQAGDLTARLAGGRLAMGQRDAVPAGSYARQWLIDAHLWDALRGQLAETDNVQAALALVARGDAPFGVVYASDALAEPAVSVVWAIPADAHDPITYPAGALSEAGAAVVDYLTSAPAQAVFARHGFAPVIQ
tara:strand:- start:46447 stop:47178 length:732 start_codon:yes stop_codon:yes gene_type:complete